MNPAWPLLFVLAALCGAYGFLADKPVAYLGAAFFVWLMFRGRATSESAEDYVNSSEAKARRKAKFEQDKMAWLAQQNDEALIKQTSRYLTEFVDKNKEVIESAYQQEVNWGEAFDAADKTARKIVGQLRKERGVDAKLTMEDVKKR